MTSGSGLASWSWPPAPATRLGGISRLTGEVVRRPTPLRLDLDRAVRTIAGFAVGTGVVFFGVALALGTPARDGFLFAVGVIVALVPEGLLPTLTPVAGHERHPHGHAWRAGPPPGGRGDPRLDDGDLHRQDRHADRPTR